MANNRDTFVFKKYKEKNNHLVIKTLSIISLFIIFGLFLILFKTKDNALLFSILGLIAIILLINIEKIADKRLDMIDWTWGRGAKAELSIMEDLEKMQGCRVINDFQMDRGNIDHICISPTGIFTIETKSTYGVISYCDGKLKRNGKELEKDFLKQARGECFFLDKLIKERLKKDYYIIPILAFANAKVDTKTISRPIENVWICQRGFECKVIENGINILSNEEIEEVYNLLLGVKNSKYD